MDPMIPKSLVAAEIPNQHDNKRYQAVTAWFLDRDILRLDISGPRRFLFGPKLLVTARLGGDNPESRDPEEAQARLSDLHEWAVKLVMEEPRETWKWNVRDLMGC